MRNTVKKIIALLCVLPMLLSVAVATQASGVKIETGKVTVAPGSGEETVQIPLNLSGNTGIAGMTLKITYTEGLTLTGISKGSALSKLTFTEAGNLSENPFKLLWDGQDADVSNGTVATLTFKVPKDTEKKYLISIETDGVFDNDLNDVSISVTSGQIEVSDSEPEVEIIYGDATGDGKINALDRAFVSRHLAKWTAYAELDNTAAADVNDDGKVNALDRAILARYLAKWTEYDVLPKK